MDFDGQLFESKLPFVCRKIVMLCRQFNVPIYMHGGSLADYYLNKLSKDFDFYVASNVEEFNKLMQKHGFTLQKYGNWVPNEVLFLFFQNINLDFFISKDLANFENYFYNTHVYNLAPINLKIPVYDFLNHKLYDPYEALSDLRKGVLRSFLECHDTFKIPTEYLENNLRLSSTHLVYKYPSFHIEPALKELIALYNKTNPYKKEYLKKFPWKVESTLLKVFSSPFESFKAVLNFWDETLMLPIFLPELEQFNSKEFVTKCHSTINAFETLNEMTKGKLASRILTSCIPQEFINTQETYKKFYDDISQSGRS